MSSEPPSPGVDLVRCPGCGRKVLSRVPRCTYCQVELGMSLAPPVAAGASRGRETCALCGLAYDASRHDACPRCTERYGQRERRALAAHHRAHRAGQLAVWVGAAIGLTAMGAIAHWGASLVAPPFGAGPALWLWATAGGAVLGLLAGSRLREHASTVERLVAVATLTVASTVWLRAALIWANGFNLGGDTQELTCEVETRNGDRTRLVCPLAGRAIADEVEDARAADDDAARVRLGLRRGRLGYWVVASDGPLPFTDPSAEDGSADAEEGSAR